MNLILRMQRSKSTYCKRICGWALAIIFILPVALFAESEKSPIDNPTHLATLKAHKSRAEELVSNNLNRFGLEKLREYDRVFDTLLAEEEKDTIQVIETSYANDASAGKLRLKEYTSTAEDLEKQKAVLEKRYHGLLRKALLAFTAWLILIFFLLRYRKSKLKKSTGLMEISEAQEQSAQQRTIAAQKLIQQYQGVNGSLQKLMTESAALTGELQNQPGAEQVQDSLKRASQFSSAATREKELAELVLSFQGDPGTEKVKTNINQLCDVYTELVYRGMSKADPDFKCIVVKDMEKNLPAIEVIPQAIGDMMLFTLQNAFLSVRERFHDHPKGYTPKITVSTRILPRFVQIRIKDNGMGINDDVQAQMMKPYYSTRSPHEGSGLGLPESQRIIQELHKGEMKIESQVQEGTDVYLKFFIA